MKYYMLKIILWFVCCFTNSLYAEAYSADILFKQFSQSIFQVRIIDINSGSQFSIGTGFLVGNGSLIATNYHVVSSLIEKPEQYQAEIDINSNKYYLDIISFDVINDLAVLRTKNSVDLGEPLILSDEPLSKGTLLYSIGNPHDIGMTVVEGTYNGLVEHRFIESIHFSGSVNPGMSGGPTIDGQGKVVGINVATSGEQIGFLVPVDKLYKLLNDLNSINNYPPYDLMEKQITFFSDRVIDELLKDQWPIENMGKAQVFSQISSQMSCWGNSEEHKKLHLTTISKGCANKDRVYISPTFDVGFFGYEFEHYQVEQWSPAIFYRYLSHRTANGEPGNNADKENVTNYVCQSDIIDKADFAFSRKVNYCVRSYKKINNLYDVFYISVSIDKKNTALMEHYTLSGVTSVSANRFLQRFIEVSSWQ